VPRSFPRMKIVWGNLGIGSGGRYWSVYPTTKAFADEEQTYLRA
jgi:hypothetical protein